MAHQCRIVLVRRNEPAQNELEPGLLALVACSKPQLAVAAAFQERVTC
jgi:hypothetical protein